MLRRIKSVPYLARVVLTGTCAVTLTGCILNDRIQRKIRQTKTYNAALEIVNNHAATVKHLGEPISQGRVKVDNSKDPKKLNVNLKGSKTKGTLYCKYIVKPDKKTEITKVEIKFSDIPNEIFVIHEI